jgi:hypothetical protein
MPDITQARNDFIAGIAASKPHKIALDPDPEDFSVRAKHVEHVIDACKSYLTALVADAADNEPGSSIADADLVGTIDAHLCDLAGDITGTLEKVAERIASERYGDAAPMPHYNRRRKSVYST